MSKKDPEVPAPAAPAEPPAVAAAEPGVDYYDQLLRLKAEFENFRKRTDRERPELVRFGRAEVLARLLPLCDVLLQAHEQVQRRQGQAEESLSALAKGMELIFKEFEKLLESEGVRRMEAQGKPFDHDRHDVMGAEERADLAEGTVVEVLQAGYLLDGKVLRHAKVRIARKPAPPPEEGPHAPAAA